MVRIARRERGEEMTGCGDAKGAWKKLSKPEAGQLGDLPSLVEPHVCIQRCPSVVPFRVSVQFPAMNWA